MRWFHDGEFNQHCTQCIIKCIIKPLNSAMRCHNANMGTSILVIDQWGLETRAQTGSLYQCHMDICLIFLYISFSSDFIIVLNFTWILIMFNVYNCASSTAVTAVHIKQIPCRDLLLKSYLINTVLVKCWSGDIIHTLQELQHQCTSNGCYVITEHEGTFSWWC